MEHLPRALVDLIVHDQMAIVAEVNIDPPTAEELDAVICKAVRTASRPIAGGRSRKNGYQLACAFHLDPGVAGPLSRESSAPG